MKSLSCVRLFVTPWTVASIHGIFQARVLEWGAISSSRGSSQPRDRTQVSRIAGRHFTVWATTEAVRYYYYAHYRDEGGLETFLNLDLLSSEITPWTIYCQSLVHNELVQNPMEKSGDTDLIVIFDHIADQQHGLDMPSVPLSFCVFHCKLGTVEVTLGYYKDFIHLSFSWLIKSSGFWLSYYIPLFWALRKTLVSKKRHGAFPWEMYSQAK